MPKSKAPAEYHALAKKLGFKWLGPTVNDTHTKTNWECGFGHRWSTAYHTIVTVRTGCPHCARNARKYPSDYLTLAVERGFRWLGPEVSRSVETTEWQCPHGHKWMAPYSQIKFGTGCPHCSNHVPKTETDYLELAKERGLKWLGPMVEKTKTNTWWECMNGHKWFCRYDNIRQGKSCPYCLGVDRKQDAAYDDLAKRRGFIWLGLSVPNTHTKTMWQCECGHVWEASYSRVQGGRGCPYCADMVNGAKVSRPQRDLCDLLAGTLNYCVGPYAIDVAIHRAGAPIAVEYDAYYWHAGREDYDAARDKDLITAGWRVLRVKSNEQLPTPAQIDAAIASLLAGASYSEIILDDWGSGPTFASIP